jgi:hypothetical protein
MASVTPKGIKTSAIQTPSKDNLVTVARQLKEVAEVGQRLRGDPGDSFVRVSELVQAGIMRLVNGTLQPPTPGSLPGSVVPSSRKVNGGDSITGGGDLTVDRTLTLVGDSPTPGNTMLYGTNSSGTKGWYTQPSGGSGASPLTTKGDIWVFGSADTRLPVGTNAQVLTADSTQATGLSYKVVPFSKGAQWVASTGPVTVPANDVNVEIPYACTLKEVTILGDGTTGSCVVDIWKATVSTFPPTSANDITGGVSPSVSAAKQSSITSFSGWTTTFAADDVLQFHLHSSSTFTRVTITLRFG